MEKKTFEYTYSAQQQEEIRRIVSHYQPAQEDPMTTIRRLDQSASCKARMRSLCVGVIGTLVMGSGMSLVMTELAALPYALPAGLLLGLTGILLVVLAYPVYERTLKKQRKKIAPQILQLSEQLLK